MKFYRLYNIIAEGFFQLPRRVFSEIENYYILSYRKVIANNIQRITEKQFPTTKFKIDLNGTRYEFLKELGELSVDVTLTMDIQSYFHEYNDKGEDTLTKNNTGNIHLSLKNFSSGVYHVIEHEMLHYIQYLIQKYKILKKYKTKEVGGLPSKDHVSDHSDIQGYKNIRSGKRIKHSHRPIEYYTNLMSAIRELQYVYSNIKGIPDRKESFISFLNRVNKKDIIAGILTRTPLADWVFKTVKESNPALYRVYLKTAYDIFVNKESDIDVEKIKQEISTAVKAKEEYEKSKPEPTRMDIIFGGSPLKIDYHNRSDFSNLDDGNYAFAEELFDKLPYVTRKTEKKYGDEYYSMSIRLENLKKIFNRIWREEILETDPELKANYHYFAERLYDNVVHHVDPRDVRLSTDERSNIRKLLFR